MDPAIDFFQIISFCCEFHASSIQFAVSSFFVIKVIFCSLKPCDFFFKFWHLVLWENRTSKLLKQLLKECWMLFKYASSMLFYCLSIWIYVEGNKREKTLDF